MLPDVVAVIFDDEQLSYRELNERANQLAHYLRQQGVGLETLVGISLERSVELVVALLGVLKAGAAYLPLDADYPPERLALMLGEADVSVLLTQQSLLGRLPKPLPERVICLQRGGAQFAEQSRSNPDVAVGPDNLSHVIYTSGSTGGPKGVAIAHRSVVRLVKETNYASFSDKEVFLQLAPVSFDAATLEVWGPLLNGGRLVVFPATEPTLPELGAILQRHQLLEPAAAEKHQAWLRFEHPAPNDLWQMDFKGEFALQQGGRCFPLTVLDDHSRFALGLEACSNVQTEPTKAVLIKIFRRYGLPARITCDNGPPWGIANCKYTKLSVWLMRLGIIVSHSRPHHPQTQGKDERFHRTLGAEVLRYLIPLNLAVCQQRFGQWRYVYNNERPHEALGLKVPAKCYQPSNRAYPETLPALEYGPSDIVKKVHPRGHIKCRGVEYYLSMAFAGQHVALRFTNTDGLLHVYFAQHLIATINLK